MYACVSIRLYETNCTYNYVIIIIIIIIIKYSE